MSKSGKTDIVCVVGAAVMVVVTALYMALGGTLVEAASTEAPYVSRLFSTDKVHEIDIAADEDDWANMLKTATAEEYIPCTVVIDGEKFGNVAIRPKGNSSLSTVASSDSDRYSFKIEFDHYDGNTTYHGLDKLCLNNNIQDNTYMKDFLCYEMMNWLGADAPLASFAWITVNGQDWGLYTAVEAVEDSFAQRLYGADHGQIYKPDSMDMGGGGRGAEARNKDENGGNIEEMMENLPDEAREQLDEIRERIDEEGLDAVIDGFSEEDLGEIAQEFGKNFGGRMDGGGMKGGMGGSEDVLLVYSDDDPDSYPNIFDNAVFEDTVTENDRERLIGSIKAMNEGDVESSVDVDEVLRYFAVHNFVLNGDSYTGSIIHNYYLYEEDGLLSMIAWDYNLAFGGMGMSGAGSEGATSTVNSPIDSPVSSGEISQRPMVAWIFADDEYTAQYHEAMDEFVSGYFESGYFETLIDELAEMIAPYVEKDPTAFCTCEEFETGVKTLKEFCLLRAESVRGQLDGAIPSTSEGQAADSSAFVDASTVNVSDMGNQGGGMGGGFERGSREVGIAPTEETEAPAGESEEGAERVESGEVMMSAEAQEKTTQDATPDRGEAPNGDMTPPDGFGGRGGRMAEGEAPSDVPEGEMTPQEGAAPDEATPEAQNGETAQPQEMQPAESQSEGSGAPAESGDEGAGESQPQETAPTEEMPQETQPQERMAGGFEAAQAPQATDGSTTAETWALLGGSILLLAAGLLFAKFYG